MKLAALPLALALLLAPALGACGDDSSPSSTDTLDTADTTLVPEGDTRLDAQFDTPDAARSCQPVGQFGCAANENCTYIGNEQTASCVPEGVVPPGLECDSENRCQRGVCMSLNQTKSLCYQFCAENGDCGADGTCLELTSTDFKVCKIDGIYDQCDLVAQNCADPAKACYAVQGEPEPICLKAGTGEPGAECHTAGACREGYACVNDVCRAVCDPDVANSCGEAADCKDFFDDAGYCQPK